MAKFLAFSRSARQVVTVDTINGVVANLGNALGLADASTAAPNRAENLVAVFQGDPYCLYRSTANEIRLARYDFGTTLWADVAGFTAITTASGLLTTQSLHVVQNRLVCTYTVRSSAGIDSFSARRSAAADGDTWSAPVTTIFATQPTGSIAGPSVVYHNAVWFSTALGLCYYDPAGDTFGALDTGSDSLITGAKVNYGAFTFYNRDLYYVLATDNPVGAPLLYKLSQTWSVAAPTPVFTKVSVIIPATGAVTLGNDSGNYALFVNNADQISLLYSGGSGSKLVTIEESGAGYLITDVTQTMLPDVFSAEPDLGFSVYMDDRRRSNEKQTIIIRYRPAIPVSVILASWDGVTAIEQTATLDNGGAGLDMSMPDEERSDFRTFTDNQPSAFIDTYSQPFPGRVRVDYTIRDQSSRPMDMTMEYSIDTQTWNLMTQGDSDDGITSLASTPAGSSYFFHWDAWTDLDGDNDHVSVRVVARISGV